MHGNTIGDSARRWAGRVRFAAIGTAVCVAISLAVNYLLLLGDDSDAFRRSMISALVLPVLIGTPLFLYLAVRLGEIRGYRNELKRLASYDSLTTVLNRNAFSSLVESTQTRGGAMAGRGRRRGAFIVIEMDPLRDIYARYGQHGGDEAVRTVAGVVKSSIRAGDLVGRLGDGAFGVFLPGADEANAREVGERIRSTVSAAYFAPGGARTALAVTVAGVFFELQVGFDRLFQETEGQLRDAGMDHLVQIAPLDETAAGKDAPRAN